MRYWETDKVEGVKVRDVKNEQISMIPCDGVFVAIGFQPNTTIFRGQIELDEKGYIVSKVAGRTSVQGVFVAGDVHDFKYRQAVTAAGEGCRAAYRCFGLLDEQEEITISTKE